MFRVALKNLTGHKRRLAGTLTAVVLGVAFLAGTLVLSDTMRASFDSIFASANAGTDVVVQSSKSIGSGSRGQSGSLPDSLVTQLGDLPEVASAQPNIQGVGQISGADGKPIGGEGPPTLAGNWIDSPALNPYRIVAGGPPTQDGEIVIDQGAATDGNLSVGSDTTLRVPDPVPVTIVGVATFGSADSLGGTSYAGLTLADAQKYLGQPGRLSQILLEGESGISQTALLAAVKPALPPNAEAITGEQLTVAQNQQIEDGFLGFFRTFLLVFAIIALIVASFSIYNTFAVIVAQRSRESALLRALGASRSQIMRSLTLESLLIGVMASVIGLGAGIVLALGLKSLLDVIGFGLPPGGLTVTGGTVLLSLVVGIFVTVFASVFPAIKASRIPPLAALREISLDRSGTSAGRITLGVILLVFGILTLATLLIPSDYLILWRTGIGATLTFVGYLIFSPVAARPVGSALGAPIRWLRGVAGGMAQRNAIRNPRRTANTAAALMVGVAVVTLFTIFAASIKTAIDTSVAGSFRGELVMSSSNFNGAGYSPKMIEEISGVDGIAAVAPLGQGTVLANGKQVNLTVADPAELGQLVALPSAGQPVESLNPLQLAISRETASKKGLGVGNEVAVSFADGLTEQMTIGSIYEGEELVGNGIISPAIYGAHVRQLTFNTVLISLVPGADEQSVQQAVQVIADSFSAGQVQTRSEFIQSTADQIDQLLNIVYVLLILAIIIALMGITNTLSLSIYERTRELGLLRAVGQTRGQTRAMVRWESVIIALFGTLSGMVLGVVLGWALMRAVQAQEAVARFTLPVDQLVFVAIAGALVGVVAGLRPAARAAKQNILAAISTE
jgi:putative ABC transport system permease protein